MKESCVPPSRLLLAAVLGLSFTALAQGQAAAPATNPYPEVFDFKGIKLGIALSEFRRLAPIDPLVNAALKDARPIGVVCTGDVGDDDERELDLRTSDTLKEIGGTACVWAHQWHGALATQPIGAAGHALGKYRFDFARPAEGGEPRLYQIAFQPHPASFDAIKSALTEKFGA